jgi:diaminohydroxyphosphoribosylaminopyrimidine deaminase/5-amino-6-(5-phosphoribosylamino)uracil reductase
MARAIELARDAMTHPNPRVGAVVVDASGQVVGEGSHRGPGTAHAETVALAQAGEAARGATVFVTLEPCAHHGRTPPCADALVAAGVAKVVAAVTDPDPRTAGQGFQRLRDAGIEVEVGLMAAEAEELDPAYFRHRRTGMPLVTWKYAMTLDGQVAAADGSSRWVTGEEARRDVHLTRSRMDAVVVGTGTLAADDPRLDIRLDGYDGAQPVPVLVVGAREPRPDARIWERQPVVVAAREMDIPSGDLLVVAGDGRPDPVAACRALADRGLLDLMLEGGPTLAGEWWRAGVISRGAAYVAGKVAGGLGLTPLAGPFARMDDADMVSVLGVRTLGNDVRIDFAFGDVHGDR